MPKDQSPQPTDINTFLYETVFQAEREYIPPQGFPADSLREVKSRGIVKYFDNAVDWLRNPESFPNQDVNIALTQLWRLVGNKFALTAEAAVPTIGFALASDRKTGAHMPFIVLPQDFVERCRIEPVTQLQAITFSAGQLVNYFEGSFGIDAISAEKIAFQGVRLESEFMQTLKTIFPDYQLDDYQEKVIAANRKGIQSSEWKELFELIKQTSSLS